MLRLLIAEASDRRDGFAFFEGDRLQEIAGGFIWDERIAARYWRLDGLGGVDLLQGKVENASIAVWWAHDLALLAA